MKTLSLVLSLSLMMPFRAAEAAVTKPLKVLDEQSGIVTVPRRGKLMKLRIDTSEVRSWRDNGEPIALQLPGKTPVELHTSLKKHEVSTGKQVYLIAYPEGLPKCAETRALITRKVYVDLVPGADPRVLARDTGAIDLRKPGFTDTEFILEFDDSFQALRSVEQLWGAAGVRRIEPMLATMKFPQYAPELVESSYHYATTTRGRYAPRCVQEHATDWRWAQQIPPFIDVAAYQWYMNNTGQNQPNFLSAPTPRGQGPTFPSLPLPADLGDLPDYDGHRSDIRVEGAWDIRPNNQVSGDGVRGLQIKVLIVDDGLDGSPRVTDPIHPEFGANGICPTPSSHKNYALAFTPPENGVGSAVPEGPRNPGQQNIYNNNTHGTNCAGLIAARERLGSFVRGNIMGVAPQSQLMGLRLLGIGETTDEEDAESAAWGSELKDLNMTGTLLDDVRTQTPVFHISNNALTLGAVGFNIYDMGPLWHRAIKYAAEKGRFSRGSALVFPAGNGADGHLRTTYSAVTSSIYTIPVAACTDLGRTLAHSTQGPGIFVCAPSRGHEFPPVMFWPDYPLNNWPQTALPRRNAPITTEKLPPPRAVGPTYNYRRYAQGIVTTQNDDGLDYDNNFGGTSASASMVSGIIALMMNANTGLGLSYRDIMEILLRSGRVINDVRIGGLPINFPDAFNQLRHDLSSSRTPPLEARATEWRMGPMGKPFHESFGTGLVDAEKAVRLARNWDYLPTLPPITLSIPLVQDRVIPDNDPNGIEISIPPPRADVRVEHVAVRVEFSHDRRGDVGISLFSPPSGSDIYGIESRLYVPHREDYQQSVPVTDTELPIDYDPATDVFRFVTVRHWGAMYASENNPSWKVRIWDATNRGTNTDPTNVDPVAVPVANPTQPISQRVKLVEVTYYGTSPDHTANESPKMEKQRTVFVEPRTTPVKVNLNPSVKPLYSLLTGPKYPVTTFDYFHPIQLTPPPPRVIWSPLFPVVNAWNAKLGDPYPIFPLFGLLGGFPTWPPDFPLILLAEDPLNPGQPNPGNPLPPEALEIAMTSPVAGDALCPVPRGRGVILEPSPAYIFGQYARVPQTGELVRDEKPVFPTLSDTYPTLDIYQNPTGFKGFPQLIVPAPPDPPLPHLITLLHRSDTRSIPASEKQHGRLHFVPEFAGDYTGWILCENDLGMSNPMELRIVVGPMPATFDYDTWANYKLSLEFPELDNNRQPNANPDGDSMVNLVEFITGSDPMTGSPDAVSIAVSGGNAVFSFMIDTRATGVEYGGEMSNDLENWVPAPPPVVGPPDPISGLAVNKISVPVADLRNNFRLRVTLPE